MNSPEYINIAIKLVQSINRQDVGKMLSLMTDPHKFSALDREVSDIGHDTIREVWSQYFVMCPDYMVHLRDIHVQEDRVILVLRTTGSLLDMPFFEEFNSTIIWVLTIADHLISELSIFPDTDEIRDSLGID